MKRLDKEYVKQYFKDHGCELLEEYQGSKVSMRYKCICGNESNITWNGFSNGHRCKKCAIKLFKSLKRTFNYKIPNSKEVARYFKQHGCQMLGEYHNSRTPIEYRCSCGNISKIKFYSFKEGHRCRKCCYENKSQFLKMKYADINKAFKSRGCVLLESTYTDSKTLMKYKCVCGNITQICWGNFQQGQTCVECFKNRISGKNSYNWNPDRDVVLFNSSLNSRYGRLLRSSLDAIGKRKRDSGLKLLGYSRQELRNRILLHPFYKEVKNSKWSIDHVFPIKAFIEHGVFDCSLINCLDNLRPLSNSDNCAKQDDYCESDFETWLKSKGYEFASN